MSDGRVTGMLAGVPFAFEANLPELVEYARVHLGPLCSAIPQHATVRARLSWHEGQPAANLRRRVDAAAVRIDRDLYRSGDTLHWFRVDDLRDLFLRLRWDGACLEIEGDFYFRLGNSRMSDAIRRVRQWRRRQVMRRRRFPTILSYLVYYPCWWWLEQMQDRHPIHAGAAVLGEHAVLLAGASGVGKSTLSVALGLEPQARLLGDSFVMHSAAQLWSVHEPVLLDAFSRSWLGARAQKLELLQHVYGLKRNGYAMPSSHVAERATAALLLFPRRGPRPEIRRLETTEAAQSLSSGNLLINDLRRYFAFAAVLEQLVPSGMMLRREAQIAALCAALPSYELILSPQQSCDDTVALVKELLEAASNTTGGSP